MIIGYLDPGGSVFGTRAPFLWEEVRGRLFYYKGY